MTPARLDDLKAAATRFASAGTEADEAEATLRAARAALGEAIEAAAERDLPYFLQGEPGERYRLLLHCGLRNLPREEGEEAIAARLREAVPSPAPGARALLAAMLLCQPFELRLPERLDAVPDWLLPEYATFLFAAPAVFNAVGEADRYRAFASAAVARVRDFVCGGGPADLRGEVEDRFINQAALVQAYFNEDSLRELYRARADIVEHWLARHGAPLAHSFGPAAGSPADAKRRVGVLMLEVGAQTESYFTTSYIERLSRERCTLTLYVFHAPQDALGRHMAGVADELVVLPAESLLDAVARVRADALDCLLIASNVSIDCTLVTLLAAFRLARVQMITASTPVTSGLTAADWYLSAELNDTEERAATAYTERVWRAPGMVTHYAYHHDRDPCTVAPSRESLGIDAGAVVLFSGANFFKIVPELSATWARILAQAPGTVLVLMPFNRNWSLSYPSRPFSFRVLSQLAEAGVDVGRLTILDPVPARADLHAIMGLADVYLDSYPFAGACSLLDPLLVGLPIVARSGRTFRGDIGAGLLRGLGVADMAAPDEAAYVARAVALAQDGGLRRHERQRLAAALAGGNPVFDSAEAGRQLEAAVLDVVAWSDALDAALLRSPAGALRDRLERVAARLAAQGNTWFGGLTDRELVRLFVAPCFRDEPRPEAMRMIDVGACLGELAAPFLAMGWQVDLVEPDPGCAEGLAQLAARYPGRARVHAVAVGEEERDAVRFHRSAVGLSGLSPSPYGEVMSTLAVPVTRLDAFASRRGITRVDFLKVDAEGADFAVLRSHDFAALAPRLALVEFGTEFPGQEPGAVRAAVDGMAAHGYDALVFSYEDDGNFRRQVWQYRLIGATFGQPVPRRDGHASGNILFHRRDDTRFLANALRVLLGCLRPREREPFLPS